MSTIQLDAGGLLPAKSKVDVEAAEQVVARTYRHPALGRRAVIRLTSDRLGQAEDLAMEFLGFEAPVVSAPVALQQRRSLGFAAWALINDPDNARFALDLVKRMKGAGRQARSKPGHAWDAYADMAKELGRSARHFLPPFWEEVGRTFKDLGNPTYAGRALNKSLEAERVHALASDRARRRDVVLEFVLSGCLSGNALSDYGDDLQGQYPPAEAFAIFRDLCVRRTSGGMSPWGAMPKDLAKLAKAAGLATEPELEKWLAELIDAPAMGRAPHQFWKACGAACKRLVASSPAFAVALLRHTRPEPRHYGESKQEPWFELLEEWGVLEHLWEDGHRGAAALGEPIAAWFSRIVCDAVPAPKRTLELLEKLAPRLKREGAPLPLTQSRRYGGGVIDIDVLEACLVLGIKVDDPAPGHAVTFTGWLTANVDHRFRNQDLVESPKDQRFKAAVLDGLDEAVACRGGSLQRGYRQANLDQRPFPLAARERPGVTALWRLHAAGVVARLEGAGLASFEAACARLEATLWPDTLRLFPDLAERLQRVDPVDMLQRTLQAGVFDEYGLPALERVVEKEGITIQHRQYGQYGETNLHLTFPSVVVCDKVHAHVVGSDGSVKKHELRLPKKAAIMALVVVGDDLAITYRDDKHLGHLYWASDPSQHHDAPSYGYFNTQARAVALKDGGVFMGQQVVRPGDKQLPAAQNYLHDGERFWQVSHEYVQPSGEQRWKLAEVDPQTGKQLRASVPPWFEETEGGEVNYHSSELLPAPPGAEASPLGTKNGLIGWKCVQRRDGTTFGVGIDGRRWDKPLLAHDGTATTPVALLRQPGGDGFLPVAVGGRHSGGYSLWDPSGSTIVATLHEGADDFAYGQVALLPLCFWHLLKVRDEASSKALRVIDGEACKTLFIAAADDRAHGDGKLRGASPHATESRLTTLLPAVKKLLPSAPPRLALGVARIVERAESKGFALTTIRDKAAADSTKESSEASRIIDRRIALAATHWGMHWVQEYGQTDSSVSAHLAAVAEFLKGGKAGVLPNTNMVWFAMLAGLPLRAWQTYWRVTAAKMAQKEAAEIPWLEFLKRWHDMGIAELPGQFDFLEACPDGVSKNNWGGYDISVTPGNAFGVQNGDDRFVFIESGAYQQMPYQVLRYSTSKSPGKPPGYQVKHLQKLNAKLDPASITAFLTAAETCTAPPVPTRDELAEVAANLSCSPAEIGLIWMGGLNLDSYQSNFLPAELRGAFGWKATDATAARQALRNLNRDVLVVLQEAVVAPGCAAPFATDRGPVLRSLEAAWRAKMPKRLPLDAALQKRLSALASSSRWHNLNHEQLLAVAADPAGHPMLQPRPIEIQLLKEDHYHRLQLAPRSGAEPIINGDSLRSLVQLVALVHAETPAGHPARAAMPGLIQQATLLLDHPDTLLELRSVHLYSDGAKKSPTPTEWVDKHLGKTTANAKDSVARFDDGFVAAAALDSQHQTLVAFRPSQLKTPADLSRLVGLLAIGVDDEDDVHGDFLPVVAAFKSIGFQKLAAAILAPTIPPGEWPQNPLRSAPEVVAAIRRKRKLGEDAATLYAQLLALPDPTSANVATWNGWTAAPFKKAAAELVASKLVLEAARARAGRPVFLPGEWSDLKAPWLPVETWKLAHLAEIDLMPKVASPAGGPLVLRPFEDLFTAAWQRVLDGDEPRYEEAKRRKKK